MVFFVGFSQMHHQTQMIPDAPAGAGALALEVPIAAACRLEDSQNGHKQNSSWLLVGSFMTCIDM